MKKQVLLQENETGFFKVETEAHLTK